MYLGGVSERPCKSEGWKDERVIVFGVGQGDIGDVSRSSFEQGVIGIIRPLL